MVNYEKPVVLSGNAVAEGVYTASGADMMMSDAGGDVVVQVTGFDHYGNYYFTINGFENAAKYRIQLTVNETDTVSGLNNASWGGFGGTVSGKTVTFENVCFGNQTNWHVRLWFDNQGNWENGWRLQDNDIPSLSVLVTKIL